MLLALVQSFWKTKKNGFKLAWGNLEFAGFAMLVVLCFGGTL
jgi:hypothetical protein